MHYSLVDAGPSQDGTVVRLELADTVEREGFAVLADGYLLTLFQGGEKLQPGQEAATFSWKMGLAHVPYLNTDLENVELVGILPHMHKRGRKMSVRVVTDGRDDCAADVDRWDFDWQQAFFYDQAIAVNPTSRLEVTCEWDTRDAERPIGPGFGTGEEMCLVGLYLSERG